MAAPERYPPGGYNSPEAFDEAVLRAACHFRLHRFGPGGRAEMQTPSLAEALRAARAELKAGRRVLLYAVDAQGRAALLPQARWAGLAAMTGEADANSAVR